MATKYEIPRLENDVIVTLPLINPELTRQPHLFNLPLHPFDVFTYGKVYSIPLLARHNESHVLADFSEYIDSGHFKKLIPRPSRRSRQIPPSSLTSLQFPIAVDSAPPRTNKFREWLASESTPLPQHLG